MTVCATFCIDQADMNDMLLKVGVAYRAEFNLMSFLGFNASSSHACQLV